MNRKARRHAATAIHGGLKGQATAARLRQALALAAKHREAGRLDAAAKLYRSILASAPEQAEALHWLGVLEHRRGRNEVALALLERAAHGTADDPQCHYHLGEIRRALGHLEPAVESYRKALGLAPGVADIHFSLGTTLLDLGRAEAAATALRRAVKLSPEDPEVHNNLGNALAELGDLEAAERHYRTALRLRPDDTQALMNLGVVLAQKGRDAEAEACHRAAVDADSGFVEARLELARFLDRQERAEEALAVLATAVEIAPDHAAAHNALGRALVKAGRHAEGIERYRRAVALRPDFAEAHFNLGVCLQAEGRFDEAVAAHEQALALRPDLGEAHYNLSMIKRDKAGEAEIARLKGLLARPELSDQSRINLNFSLARHYETLGEVDAAFCHYRSGNDLKARNQPFDAARHVDYVDRLIATFDRDFFAARRDFGVRSELPVFIVGMPRSGTTLVEQILSSHPAVHGAGELDEFRLMVDRLPRCLGSEQGHPECVAKLRAEAAESLAAEYLASLRGHSAESLRITDKMTGNYIRLGLIALLLPRAVVIHCRRDPLDTCVSCYFHNFAQGLSFTYDLGHLGLVYREYERLMDHWQGVLPVPILELRYEDLIADQEGVSRRIVEFCNLPWDERCLNFHETTRRVRTASFWQVRQPVYATSVRRWCAFADHLGPLFEALGHADREGA